MDQVENRDALFLIPVVPWEAARSWVLLADSYKQRQIGSITEAYKEILQLGYVPVDSLWSADIGEKEY